MSQHKQKINVISASIAAFATLLFVVSSTVSVFAAASPITTEAVIKLVNDARTMVGVKQLSENSRLDQAAQKKAEDMIKNSYFAHTSPAGVSPWHWFDEAGYDYLYAGENLAINFKNAQDQQYAWMQSTLHRKNILNEKYEEIGVASVQGVIDGHTSVVTVQLFGTAAENKSKVLPVKNAAIEDETQADDVSKTDDKIGSKPIVLSVHPPTDNEPPFSPGNYAGMIAAGATFFAIILIALTDTVIIMRKRKLAQDLHQLI